MGYQPKIIRGKVKNTGYPIDGLVLLFSLWDYDNYESYHLTDWSEEDNEAVIQTMYQSEQKAGICLFDDFESYSAALKSGEYELECVFCLDLDEVDVLEVVVEERGSSDKSTEEIKTDGTPIDRLTVKSEIIDGYTLKCMCSFGRDGIPDDESTCYEYCEMWGDKGCKQCEQCGIQQAFDKLAAYENTELSPEEVAAIKADNERLIPIPKGKDTEKLVFYSVDTETTGLKSESDEILQLSIVDENGNVVFNEYFCPSYHLSWDEAEKINHITRDMVIGKPTIKKRLSKINAIFAKCDVIIAFNAEFDLSFLKAAGIEIPKSTKVIDVQQMYMGIAALRGEWDWEHNRSKWRSLKECAKFCGYEWQGAAHDSLADAQAAMACCFRLARLMRRDVSYDRFFEG